MRSVPLLIILTASAGCAPKERISDWRYTSWDMNQEAVIAASHGTAVPAAPGDQSADRLSGSRVLLRAPVSWLGQSWTALFGFAPTADRLVSVTLQLTERGEGPVRAVQASLKLLYGFPSSAVEQPGVQILSWSPQGEHVAFVRLTDSGSAVGAPVTSVNYQPAIP
jgi:hypothetical protein